MCHKMTPYGVKKGGYALLFYALLLPVPTFLKMRSVMGGNLSAKVFSCAGICQALRLIWHSAKSQAYA